MLYYLSHLFLEDINQNGFMLDKYRIILIEIMRCNNFIRNKITNDIIFNSFINMFSQMNKLQLFILKFVLTLIAKI